MLSYLHGYHAGNFADLHKHHLLVCLLAALNRKNKPWNYLETHAGKAHYALSSEQSEKTAEYREGIVRLWAQQDMPDSVATYLQQIRAVNPEGTLTFYPGSPALAAGMARADDRLHLMELHPGEVQQLKRAFSDRADVAVHHRDGYEGVLSLLPPKPNRGLVLIDPSYEVKSEYDQVAAFLPKALKRWPNGCFAVWYPLLPAGRWKMMLESIRRSGLRNILRSELRVRNASDQGMYGSGMLIINPPWPLADTLQQSEPWLAECLAQDAGAGQLISWLVEE
ncbi:DNA processing protein [Nitrincola sp. A-D6]|uniref:23S rRNA (adenine(2030)-N(6))-methyltransferase RlmJ n=1 Tax=Nitrincola sp. A-D6 TaxID=1545442 RepID=UPI00051FD6A3|nr:23S rRNA (adenine(2030)-N(6))-methyltransferase RlmJ [Nitrincola sp. A-D6]KGK41952.1 DNA processing protein [Nitrincola sp. A-D6]